MQTAPLPRTLPPVLEVENLTVSFRVEGQWREVVRNVGFEVAPGETLAIVGESGSGKSVTSLAIMRLLPPGVSRVEGRIALNGADILAIPDNRMREVRGRDVAMIFQEPMTSLNPLFTVGDQISEAILCHNNIPRAEAMSEALGLLERVRIPDARMRLAEYPHRLSGGMRQRVMIAMALASRARLLIADEPTTALDVTIQGQILDLIKSIQAETGMSVLFITHDMGVVAEVSDRTLVMFRGDHVETGTTAEVFRHPRADYTRHLLAAVPVLGSMSGKSAPEPFPLGADALEMHRAATPKAWSEPPRRQPDVGQPVDLPIRERTDGGPRPLLKVRNLSKRFDMRGGVMNRLRGRVHAVEDVSFDLHPGETLSLVGESGCGKSTTGRLILRLIEADGGSARIGDTDVLAGGRAEMRAVRRAAQMIFQDPFASLDPSMTVGDAIAEPWLEHGYGTRSAARTRVAELLSQVGLPPEVRDRYPHEFSGGQRQRICIARALALDPQFIVADESVSALDVTVKGQICNLLLDLQQRLGVAFLFISHDMAVVERISHRVAVMYLGRIVEIGPRQAVFDSPLHPYTRKLLAAVPVADPDRRHLARGLVADEIRSPIRPPEYRPAPSRYIEVSPGHFVLADATDG